MTQKLTPMFEQYLRIKEEHPDALLFFRMGDFYELFFEDAEIAARDLSIALTCRNPNAETKVPMCGVPHHAAESYLSQLLEKGRKVAVCDQIEDPRQAKGLVKRAVTRVLTPGTVVEDSNLQGGRGNFLAALYWNGDKGAGGLAWLDYSTGECSGLQAKSEAELWQWVQKIDPKELLLTETQKIPSQAGPAAIQVNRLTLKSHFSLAAAKERIFKAQNIKDLSVVDLADKPELTQALGAVVAYLVQTQKSELEHMGPFSPLNLSKHLILDEVTEKNLEIFRRLDGGTGPGTLIHALDRTMCPMGARLLRRRLLHPWRELKPIQSAQESVEYFFNHDRTRRLLRDKLKPVYDLERLSTRIFLGRASPKDFISLRNSLAALPGIERALVESGLEGGAENPPLPAPLRDTLASWDNLEEYKDLLERALVDNPPHIVTEGGLFRPGYDAELDGLLELTEHGEARLEALLDKCRSEFNLPKLKLGFNKVFGYFFELSKAFHSEVPPHFARKQTLANSERYATEDLKELEEKLLSASDKRKSLEYRLFQELRQTMAQARERFLFMADLLAGIDYWQGLAEAARTQGWTRPRMTTDLRIRIKSGRHPVVEAVQGGANFIPNDLELDEDKRILIITGPNMAGKSTVLRQAAIICILAQIGSFVPAAEAELGLSDRVFSRVGASDNLAQGQSTFMVEMTETARILRQATKKSLVILDEIGRGTSTFDGLALAWAVVEELAGGGRGPVRTLFATHYHELTALEGKIPGVRNFNIAVKEWNGEIIFLRRLVPGPSDRSYGIEVARLAGAPRSTVRRAKSILARLEKQAGDGADQTRDPLSSQVVLPGFFSTPAKDETAPQAGQNESHGEEILKELGQLRIDRLTPLEALNILHQWKTKWGG